MSEGSVKPIVMIVWRRLLMMAFLIKKISALDDFECPNRTETKSCFCSHYEPNSEIYTIYCNNKSNIRVIISPSKTIDLHCKINTPPSAYEELPVLVGNNSYVANVTLKFCPSPDVPFRDIMRNMRITKVERFSFRRSNYTDFLLDGLHYVTELDLQLNRLKHLPDDIFEHMKNLTTIDLSENNIKLTEELKTFKSLTKLLTLRLNNNDISILPRDIFSTLLSLQRLYLERNHIKEIISGTFDSLEKLTDLDLSSNILKTLPSDLFSKMPNLNNLSLKGNCFTSFPNDLFKMNNNIKILQLKGNNASLTKLPDHFLANFHVIKDVDLNDLKLEIVPENMFTNSTALLSISLKNNMIENIPKNIFRDQKKLQILDLSKNEIKNISLGVFEYNSGLKNLILDHNSMAHLQSELLCHLTKLEKLSIKNNKIATINYDAFRTLTSLKFMTLSGNLIGVDNKNELQNCDFAPDALFKSLKELIYMDLSHNNISGICNGQFSFGKLESLNLSHNRFTLINYEQFNGSNLTVDLTSNHITDIIFEPVTDYSFKKRGATLLLEDNPVICDCRLHDFLSNLKTTHEDSRWRGVEQLTCANASAVNLSGTLISNVDLDELLCQVSESCPDYCECYKRYNDQAFIVKCTNITEEQVPAELKNPKRTNHTEMHLENNRLTSFKMLQLETKNRNVTKLYLQKNMITDLSSLTERGLGNIEVLDLRYNLITHINSEGTAIFQQARLSELWLLGNNIACDCRNYEFLSFLEDMKMNSKITDAERISCPDSQNILKQKLQLLCSGVETWVVVLSVFITLAAVVIGLFLAFFYKYSHEIRVYLFTKGWCLSLVTEEELDKDKLYDAFFCFSHKDEDFVINELVTKLENGPHAHKLCIHFRDWIPGEMISTQIKRSIEDSKRTIVVLSPNFLDSVWGQVEFREAYSHALKEGRARVILILYCDIEDRDNLDVELQAYLKINTYIKWGDPWFWKKLRYALPHKHRLPFLEQNIEAVMTKGKSKEKLKTDSNRCTNNT